MIQQAYEAGKRIKKAILNKKGDIKIAVHALQSIKGDKFKLCHEYLKLCLDYDVTNSNEFMIDMLSEKTDSTEVGISICLGLITADEESDCVWITLQKAAELWGKDDSTLRRVIKGNRFSESDSKKEGRDWLIKKSAMEKVYGNLEGK